MATWIAEYMIAHRLTVRELAGIVRHLSLQRPGNKPPVSAGPVIGRLLRNPGDVTHPSIADLIAEACGATAEQRDMIVPEKYRGEWAPKSEPRRGSPASTNRGKSRLKPILAIARDGKVVAEFPCCEAAAAAYHVSHSYIYARCGDTYRPAKEYAGLGITFRFKYPPKQKKTKGAANHGGA